MPKFPSLNTLRRNGQTLNELLDEIDHRLVLEALRKADCNIQHAAELLGLSRSTLQGKMRKHKIRVRRSLRVPLIDNFNTSRGRASF